MYQSDDTVTPWWHPHNQVDDSDKNGISDWDYSWSHGYAASQQISIL